MNERGVQAKRIEEHLKKHGGEFGKGFGYTDEDNPFHDPRLSQRFVWGKKIEKQLEEGTQVKELTAKAEAKRYRERMEEIEKVKRRREEREREKAAIAEELELIQRERAMAEAVDLERKEEEFHLEQAKVRAQQRMAAGRPKAIDLITNNLFLLDGFDETEKDPPLLISSLNVWQLKELVKDIAEYSALDARDEGHMPFWKALMTVAVHELNEAIKQEEIDSCRVRGIPIPAKYQVREAGWHESLEADVASMLAGKSHAELTALERGITEQLDSGDAADPDYWAAVLRRLEIYQARALLREFHSQLMHRRLAVVTTLPRSFVSGEERAAQAKAEAAKAAEQEAEQEGEAEEAGKNEEEIVLPEDEEKDGEDQAQRTLIDSKLRKVEATKDEKRGEPSVWEDLDKEERVLAMASTHEFSPVPLPPEHFIGQDVVPEEEDLQLLEMTRSEVRARESRRFLKVASSMDVTVNNWSGGASAAERIYDQMIANPGAAGSLLGESVPLLKHLTSQNAAAELPVHDAEEAVMAFRDAASKAMGDLSRSGDAPFGGEVAVDSQVYWWHEKYRPRKPKYFNRVHTGYDWNKYNRTHYDADNPPPKTVQGYKFNVFYPDLIDPTKAPNYVIERDLESVDGSTCILRFTAGPPYEDVAFRIVNKDWELNPKRGFKCVFDRGILQLYFNFRRQFYRR
jgi:hypothetical protein